MTRAQTAVFLSRAFNLAEGSDPGFTDVPADAWYAADVARLAASGITASCGDGTIYCPSSDTTRGQMATFRCGSFVDTSRDHPVPYRDRFVDSQGNLTDWGEQICYSAGRHTVEVWTESGVRKTVTIPAT